jgi:uncharacterized protein YhfF
MSTLEMLRFSFGDSPAMADALLALVLEGKKTATCWAAVQGDQGVKVGVRAIVLDGQDHERAVIETVELTKRRFDEVDEAFAFQEGEDDRTLASWRKGHEAYFRRERTFAPDMMLYCERFRLVETLG